MLKTNGLVLRVLITSCPKLHGGAHLRAFRLIAMAAAMILASSVVRADGLDGRVNVNGGGPGSPPCGSTQFFAGPNGQFDVDCTTTVNTPVITFAVLDSQTDGGLSCASKLTSIGWKETSSSVNGVGQFGDGDKEGDCDLDDFLFGISKGCDIILNTNVDGTLPFAPNAAFDLSVNGAPLLPLPEPTSLALLATGLATLVLGRRRSKNVRTEI
jgi:hypothetical protein